MRSITVDDNVCQWQPGKTNNDELTNKLIMYLNQATTPNYWAPPFETIYDPQLDCDDTSIIDSGMTFHIKQNMTHLTPPFRQACKAVHMPNGTIEHTTKTGHCDIFPMLLAQATKVNILSSLFPD